MTRATTRKTRLNACLLAACLLATCAILTTSASAQDTLLGAALRSRPDYDGASDQVGDVIPVIRYYGQPWFARTTQGVLEGGHSLAASPPVAVTLKLAPSLCPRVVDEPPQALDQRRPERGILPGIGTGKLGGLLAECVEIEIRRGFDDGLVHWRGRF